MPYTIPGNSVILQSDYRITLYETPSSFPWTLLFKDWTKNSVTGLSNASGDEAGLKYRH